MAELGTHTHECPCCGGETGVWRGKLPGRVPVSHQYALHEMLVQEDAPKRRPDESTRRTRLPSVPHTVESGVQLNTDPPSSNRLLLTRSPRMIVVGGMMVITESLKTIRRERWLHPG
jgi:hypothetical protein